MSFLPAAIDDKDVYSDDEPIMFGEDGENGQDSVEKRTSATSMDGLESVCENSVIEFAHVGNQEAEEEEEKAEYPSSLPPPSALKKNYDIEEIPVCTKRKSWKNLPAPCMKTVKQNEIKRVESSNSFFHLDYQQQAATKSKSMKKSNSKVDFKDIIIREYDLTLGDNPSVSFGPAVSLDWNYSERGAICIEEYEGGRGGRRSMRQMATNYYRRKALLTHVWGHTEEEMNEAKKEINKIKTQRAITRQLLPVQKLEDALESASRKMKRAMSGSRKKIGTDDPAAVAITLDSSTLTSGSFAKRSISAPSMA